MSRTRKENPSRRSAPARTPVGIHGLHSYLASQSGGRSPLIVYHHGGWLRPPGVIRLTWRRVAKLNPTNQEKIGIVVIVMKIEISILAGLLLLGTELMARTSVQGVEQAIVSAVIAAGNVLR
jgi:hypothetical protein